MNTNEVNYISMFLNLNPVLVSKGNKHFKVIE